MADGKRQFPLSEIHEVSFLILNDIEVSEVLEAGRVIWLVESSETVRRLLRLYETNPLVPIKDFVQVLRRTRRKMLDRRDSAIEQNKAYGGNNGREQNFNK